MIVLCVLFSLVFSKVTECSRSGVNNYVLALADYFNNSNSQIGIFYDAELVRLQRKSEHLAKVTIGVNIGSKHNESIIECSGDVSSDSGTPIVIPQTAKCRKKSKDVEIFNQNSVRLDTYKIDLVNAMRSVTPEADKKQHSTEDNEFTVEPKCVGCSNIKSSLKEVDILATRTIKQMNKKNPGIQHELKSILSAKRRILNADYLKYILHTSIEFKNCTGLFGCWSESKTCRIEFTGQFDWFRKSYKNKSKEFISWTCTKTYSPKENFLSNYKFSNNTAVRTQKPNSTNSDKSSENHHQIHFERKWKTLNINIPDKNSSKTIITLHRNNFHGAKTNKSMLRKRRDCPKDELKHAAFNESDSSGSKNVDVKSAIVVNLLDFMVYQFNNITQAGTKFHIDHVVNATTNQNKDGITRYVIRFDINNGLEYLHCHSQTLTKNLVALNVSSNITCMKKNISAGYNNEDPSDPKFRKMAQESLMKYDKEKNLYKVRDILFVKTQVLAGYATYIEFTASPTNCTRRLHLASFYSNCSVTNPRVISACNTRILVQTWLNKTNYDISCEVVKAAPAILRGKKQSASVRRFGEDIFHMAMQALDKYVTDKQLVYKYKIMDIKTVNIENISGTVTKIVFDISQTFCTSGDKIPIDDCNLDESIPVKTCHAEIWDVQVLKDRIINILCHIHNSDTRELVEEADDLNDGNLGPKLINVKNKEDRPVTEETEATDENGNDYDNTSPVDSYTSEIH